MKIYSTFIFGIAFLFSALVSLGNNKEAAAITVAKDGSGDYLTIQEAINSCRAFQTYDKVIHIKNGIYKEKVLIDSFFSHLHLIGESRDSTIITFDDYAGKGNLGTFTSYTMKIMGDNTILENLSIINSSGEVGQAVALHIEGDCVEVRNCNILGNQDTLYAAGKRSRQYFTNCFIDGTTDFIFGASIAVFDNCTLHSKRNSYITAANSAEENKFGYVFRNCKLSADPKVDKVYLGRPWRDFAKVVFIECEMDNHITPKGWHNWDQAEREKTSYYAEYKSIGEGANAKARVKWSHQISDKEIKKYNLKEIFNFYTSWIPTFAN